MVSALAVHHLDAAEKAALFRRVAARLAPGGRFVLADVIVPDDPADAVTPLDEGYDMPSRADEQLQWMSDAKLTATLRWKQRDLAVMVGDRNDRRLTPRLGLDDSPVRGVEADRRAERGASCGSSQSGEHRRPGDEDEQGVADRAGCRSRARWRGGRPRTGAGSR